jgi:hypothetical protein
VGYSHSRFHQTFFAGPRHIPIPQNRRHVAPSNFFGVSERKPGEWGTLFFVRYAEARATCSNQKVHLNGVREQLRGSEARMLWWSAQPSAWHGNKGRRTSGYLAGKNSDTGR